MLRLLRLTLFTVLFAAALSLGVLATVSYLALSDQANVPPLAKPVAQAADKQVIASGKIVLLDEELANMISTQIRRQGLGSAVRLRFFTGHLAATASLELPISAKRRFVNISILSKQVGHPEHLALDTFKIGNVELPAWLTESLQGLALERCTLDRRCRAALNAWQNIDSLHLEPGQARVAYQLASSTKDSQGNKISIDELELEDYIQALQAVGTKPKTSLPMHAAMKVVMQLAQQRSVAGDSVRENTSALLALALLANDAKVQNMLLESKDLSGGNTELVLKIHKRRDLSQHFLNSSALFLIGGAEFSDYVGLYKEIMDAARGKPFSIPDLVADRTGVRFAQAATNSDQKARDIQTAILNAEDHQDYFLSATELRALGTTITVSSTEQVDKAIPEIDQAIARLHLLR